MPSALETLVKILKLEREQGCENDAVIGGLQAYSENWMRQATAQARRPEHHVLAEELYDIMQGYDALESRTDRLKQVDYMIARITRRQPLPDAYKARLKALRRQQKPRSGSRRYAKRSNETKQDTRRPSHKKEKPDNAFVRDDRNDYIEAYDTYYQPISTGQLDIKPMPRLERPPRRQRHNVTYEEASKKLRELQKPVTRIKGIGSTMAEKLARLGIETIMDMLLYTPRHHDNYMTFPYIAHLQPEQLARVLGTVQHTEVRAGRNNRKDFFMRISDGSGTLDVTFFGMYYLSRSIRKGQQIVVQGRVKVWRDTLQMSNPEYEAVELDNLNQPRLVPIYGLTEGLKPRSFRNLMERVVNEWADFTPDYIPEATLERADLADIHWTLKNLHFPEGEDHKWHAQRRYIFDELLMLQLAILENRREWQSVAGQALTVTDAFLEEFISAVFPYELTGAQKRAVDDIRRDVTQAIPMNRLIQGDVGSGKTAVATVAMAMALANGKQAALMAPTSILAEQHYRGIGATLEKMPAEQRPVVALLTSALTNTERQSVYRGIADGSIDVVIGTHALIEDGVDFNDLAVAIIDEQHRFGVQQRGALRGKGTNPHLLVMTATPIPRTLALTRYADLDLTLIDEKPPGRQPVQTRVWQANHRERAFSFIETQLEHGRQAFIVHPLVEASEKIEARSATEAYEELQQIFHQYRVCLLHGRMKPTEKDEIMAAFARKEFDVMVTTTVAEVGVDVPNANVIMIEGANRFGLSQLHQLRGRVGRGAHQSYCILIPDNDTPDSKERLAAMEETEDGFKLAEKDWELRGAGELLGTRQSGSHILQIAEQITPDLVVLAQQEARTLYAEDPYLQQDDHRLLAERVAMMQDERMDVS